MQNVTRKKKKIKKDNLGEQGRRKMWAMIGEEKKSKVE